MDGAFKISHPDAPLLVTVPGRNACEISMIHQEDLCMQREMAKMAFNRGIWSYVKKMDTNLRKFAVQGDQFCQGQNAVTFAHKVH